MTAAAQKSRPSRPWDRSAPSWQRWAFILAPVVGVLVMAVVHVVSFPAYEFLVREDGLAEWLSFVFYLSAALLGFTVANRLRARGLGVPAALYLLVSLGLVFVAGEEISWGQRQLGFAGPEALVERNLQSEANLHNLLGHVALHSVYVAVGLYAALAHRFVHRLPVLQRHPRLFAPPPEMALYFLLVVAYYLGWFFSLLRLEVAGVLLNINRVDRFQEFPEMVLSLGFLLFFIHARDETRSLSRQDHQDAAAGQR